MLNDPIADMLTRIRNAQGQKHRFVEVRYSKLNIAILDVLKEEGFIQSLIAQEENDSKDLRIIKILLKYDTHRRPLISAIQRVSKPGRRRYVKSAEVPVIQNGLGLAIVSTSKGIMSGKRAKDENVGGEILGYVY